MRVPTLGLAAGMALLASFGPALAEYEWSVASPTEICVSISASSEQIVLSGDPWVGERTLYFWTQSCGILDSQGSEFSFQGTLEVVDLIPAPGVTNLGTVDSPILRYDDCLDGHVVAEVVVRDVSGAGGYLCLGPSIQNGVNGSFKCPQEFPEPQIWLGFASDGSSCEGGPLTVESGTWGSVKDLYR